MMRKSTRNLDIDLVRAFVTIVDMRSFTRAAARLNLQQSTISLQIRRLEDALGHKLVERNPRMLKLTSAGEIFLEDARRLLEINDRIVSNLTAPEVHGKVRLGTPEDFATRHLPDVLSQFAQAYPAIALEVTCELTLNLLEHFRRGAFDLALIKRERSLDGTGTRVWREPLVWVRGEKDPTTGSDTLPLVLSPPPCVYRKQALHALDRARRKWRIAYTCESLTGTLAAVRAGLGISVLPKDMIPGDLHPIDGGPLPSLKDTEIALLQAKRLSPAAQRLREHIIRSLN
jgi:DNA-binding transcriptional LysR family regulator